MLGRRSLTNLPAAIGVLNPADPDYQTLRSSDVDVEFQHWVIIH
jgi:hypothetical protein